MRSRALSRTQSKAFAMSLLDQILTDKVNYVALSVPVFFLLMGLEVLYSWLAKKDYYRLDDSINDLSCGIIQQVFGIFIKGGLFAGYLWIYQDFRLLELPDLFDGRPMDGGVWPLFWGSTFAITGFIASPTR